MTIELINDILFPIFLFFIYFSIGVFLLDEINSCSSTDTIAPDYTPAFSEENDPDIWFDDESSEATSDEQVPVINLASFLMQQLKQSQLRKLCRPLGIASKSKGKWIPTAQMRNTIEAQAQSNPDKFIKVVQEKLPKLAAALSV